MSACDEGGLGYVVVGACGEGEKREREREKNKEGRIERERNTIVSQMRMENDAACVNIRGRDRGRDRGK